MSTVRPVITFLSITFALPWLLWLASVSTEIVAAGSMLCVGIATAVTTRLTRTGDTGLTIRPLRTVGAYCALALIGVLGLAALAVAIGTAAGVHRLDLTGFSGLHQVFGSGPTAAVMFAALAKNAIVFVILLPFAFCEEWGWRGFLLPRLLPLGTWTGLLTSGVIWALWHLPGYVGPHARPAFLSFAIFCVLFGTLLGWLRMTTNSIWPSTVAHAAYNTLVLGFVNVAFTDSAELATPNPWTFGMGGWPGWLVMSVLITILAVTGRIVAGARRSHINASH
ncbi:CPBP family intramembrane metalloprotease [Lentzea sp. NEAU-D13]|uniref:CPBP family intramembrane metalloprotease n=1 Tax=Lentzea alba TaxID=2714351 RepID=A0A7C9VYX3_9PSEU|nr:type II CAAX endopeptidase family protein [Lentzea alba]NGY66492.1 CPBP family intramembrane metalloprotease [Lentzea alba]